MGQSLRDGIRTAQLTEAAGAKVFAQSVVFTQQSRHQGTMVCPIEPDLSRQSPLYIAR